MGEDALHQRGRIGFADVSCLRLFDEWLINTDTDGNGVNPLAYLARASK